MSYPLSIRFAAAQRIGVPAGTMFRQKRIGQFLEIVDQVISERGYCRVIDLGGETRYWDSLREHWTGRAMEILLVNPVPQISSDKRIESMQGDACDLSQFAADAFDVVHSNSVIEHVGSWENKRRMANEVRRLAQRYFVQTPNFWFPMEPHFRTLGFHWMPQPIQRAMVTRKKRGCFHQARSIDEAHWMLSDSKLLDAFEMRNLFPEATIYRERVLGLTKSLVAIR